MKSQRPPCPRLACRGGRPALSPAAKRRRLVLNRHLRRVSVREARSLPSVLPDVRDAFSYNTVFAALCHHLGDSDLRQALSCLSIPLVVATSTYPDCGSDLLLGSLVMVPRMDKRVMTIARLGYKKCVVPKASYKLLRPLDLDIEILTCSNLKQLINTVFTP